MASAKQLAWRKKFARMSKAGDFRKAKKSKLHLTKGDTVSHKMIKGKMWTSVTSKGAKNPKSIGAKKSKSTTHRKTLKSNPHNPVVEDMKKLEKTYYVERNNLGYATIHRHKDGKEIFYIPNLNEFASELDIEEDNDGHILLMLDGSGAVNLPH